MSKSEGFITLRIEFADGSVKEFDMSRVRRITLEP